MAQKKLGYLYEDTLSNIGDAIREKNGETDKYTPVQMPDKIRAIQTGVDTTDGTATENDILKDKTAYVNDVKVTGALEIVTCYQGSDDPETTLGSVGDLYVKLNS